MLNKIKQYFANRKLKKEEDKVTKMEKLYQDNYLYNQNLLKPGEMGTNADYGQYTKPYHEDTNDDDLLGDVLTLGLELGVSELLSDSSSSTDSNDDSGSFTGGGGESGGGGSDGEW